MPLNEETKPNQTPFFSVCSYSSTRGTISIFLSPPKELTEIRGLISET